jgi:hypothetical protein
MRRTFLSACLVCLCLAGSGAAQASPAQDYMLYCMGCHGAKAEGVPGKVPPLAHSLGHYMNHPAGRDFVLRVPGASRSVLTDAQLAGVLNWLAKEYSSEELTADTALFTADEVTANRHNPLAAVLATRAAVLREMRAAGIPASDGY